MGLAPAGGDGRDFAVGGEKLGKKRQAGSGLGEPIEAEFKKSGVAQSGGGSLDHFSGSSALDGHAQLARTQAGSRLRGGGGRRNGGVRSHSHQLTHLRRVFARMQQAMFGADLAGVGRPKAGVVWQPRTLEDFARYGPSNRGS